MKFGGKMKEWKNLHNKQLPKISNFSRPFDGIAYWQVYNLRHFSAFAVLHNIFQQPDHISGCASVSRRNRHDRRTAETIYPNGSKAKATS
jgi:hypothetical protein